MSAQQPSDFSLPFTNYGQNGENGRVNLTVKMSAGGQAPETFAGYQYQRTSEENFENDMLRGNWETSPISVGFFSKENITSIQNQIRKTVFERSQPKSYVIDTQSVDELKIVMRAMYYQYARNLPFNISEQIKELNDRVVVWTVPHILSAVDHYYYYLNDISHLPVPMEQPMNVNRSGTKSKPVGDFM